MTSECFIHCAMPLGRFLNLLTQYPARKKGKVLIWACGTKYELDDCCPLFWYRTSHTKTHYRRFSCINNEELRHLTWIVSLRPSPAMSSPNLGGGINIRSAASSCPGFGLFPASSTLDFEAFPVAISEMISSVTSVRARSSSSCSEDEKQQKNKSDCPRKNPEIKVDLKCPSADGKLPRIAQWPRTAFKKLIFLLDTCFGQSCEVTKIKIIDSLIN